MAMKINTGEIRNAALTIRAQNKELQSALFRSKSAADALSGTWSGAAAETAISAYDQFAAKFFPEYQQMLDDYANFLGNQAGEGYEHVENSVIKAGKNI